MNIKNQTTKFYEAANLSATSFVKKKTKKEKKSISYNLMTDINEDSCFSKLQRKMYLPKITFKISRASLARNRLMNPILVSISKMTNL